MRHYPLPPRLTFGTVQKTQRELSEFIQNKKNARICLDLSKVNTCDSAGLALLLDAKKQCLRLKKAFEIVNMPEDTKRLAAFCGVDDLLEVEQESCSG